MSEQARLGTAIRTISERYLGAVLGKNDGPGILKWSLRLADYSTRLAAIVAPPLEPDEAADTSPGEPLSEDSTVAYAQLLAAIGHPETIDSDGVRHGTEPAVVFAAATPQQRLELTLLGYFGNPDHELAEGLDWSLYKVYFRPVPIDSAPFPGRTWEPKPENELGFGGQLVGPWKAYLRGA